jgi:LAO/AO transport system kinase
MLSLNAPRSHEMGGAKAWKPPIITTVAARQEGIGELWAAIEAHRRHLESSGRAHELAERRLRDETGEVAAELARRAVREALDKDAALAARLLEDGTPYRVAEEIIGRLGRARKPKGS